MTFSFLLLPNLPIENLGLLPLLTGVSIIKGIRNITKLEVGLKWPNDIMINKKKIGGILIESNTDKDRLGIVIGIGLNINETENDFPEKLSQSATSLSIETQHSNQRELICAMVLTFFEQLLDNLDSVTSEWTNYCAHLNEITSFNHNGVSQHGLFKGINDRGQAQIEIEEEVQLFPSIILD